MDKVRIPVAADPLPRGPSYFIPFECFNIRKDGSSDSRIAVDLPPMNSIHRARIFILNDPRIFGRTIDFREYGVGEIRKSPEILQYLKLYKVVV